MCPEVSDFWHVMHLIVFQGKSDPWQGSSRLIIDFNSGFIHFAYLPVFVWFV
jgi:hypothetical protein